jgi:hypothetical protein
MGSVGRLKIGVLLIYWIFAFSPNGYGQGNRVLADRVTNSGNVMSSLLGCGRLGLSPCYNKATVLNPNQAINSNATYARLLASPGLLLGLSSFESYIELSFPQTLPANTWSYIRVSGDEDLFGALLGGSLGDVLGDVLGSVLIGRQGIEVQARNSSGTTVFSRSKTDGFNTDRARMVVDHVGNYYLAIKPDQAYDRVRLNNRSISALGIGSEYILDVYNAFYINDFCGDLPSFTSMDGSGINLDLLKLGGAVSNDIHLALDNNTSTYSSLSPGLLSVAGSVSQFLYFGNLSEPNDEVQITISGTPSLLNLDVANTVRIITYNGSTEVSNQTLNEINGLIDLDLLGLLQTGNPSTFPISPGGAFDRVEIRSGALLGLDVGEALRIHEVVRTPGRPTFENLEGIEGQTLSICPGESVDLSVSHPQPVEFDWYLDEIGGNPIFTGDDFPVDAALSESTTYYVSARRSSPCFNAESARTPVHVNIKEVPFVEEILATREEFEQGKSVTLSPVLGEVMIDQPVFSWYKDEARVDTIKTGQDGHLYYSIDENTGALSISGLTAEDSEVMEVFVGVKNGMDGCEVTISSMSLILPITWQDFQSTTEEDKIKLEWEAQRGIDGQAIVVERSADALDWEAITTIPMTNPVGHTKFVEYDLRPNLGKNYYRLKFIHQNGNIQHSEVIRSDYEKIATETFRLYPNPAIDHTILYNESGKPIEHVLVKMYDRSGRLMQEKLLQRIDAGAEIRMDAPSNLVPGMYFYHIQHGKELLLRSIIYK